VSTMVPPATCVVGAKVAPTNAGVVSVLLVTSVTGGIAAFVLLPTSVTVAGPVIPGPAMSVMVVESAERATTDAAPVVNVTADVCAKTVLDGAVRTTVSPATAV